MEDMIMRPGKMKHRKRIWLLVIFIGFMHLKTTLSQETKMPFYPKGSYLEEIPTPDEVIGFPLGEKPVRHTHVMDYFKGIGRPLQKGSFPATDDILSRSVNISIGVVDAGLGAGAGLNILSGDREIDQFAEAFIQACKK